MRSTPLDADKAGPRKSAVCGARRAIDGVELDTQPIRAARDPQAWAWRPVMGYWRRGDHCGNCWSWHRRPGGGISCGRGGGRGGVGDLFFGIIDFLVAIIPSQFPEFMPFVVLETSWGLLYTFLLPVPLIAWAVRPVGWVGPQVVGIAAAVFLAG